LVNLLKKAFFTYLFVFVAFSKKIKRFKANKQKKFCEVVKIARETSLEGILLMVLSKKKTFTLW